MISTSDAFGTGELLTNEISDGRVVYQTFVPITSHLQNIAIDFATYRRKNTSDLIIEILQHDTHEVVFSKKMSASEIVDNQFHIIDIDIDISKGTRYGLKISSNAAHGNGVTGKVGAKKHPNETLIIDKKKYPHELHCSFEYGQSVEKISIKGTYTTGLVSIVIPVFNSSKYLQNLFNSIKDQEYNNYEIIVVDDGSDDQLETLKAIEAFKGFNISTILLSRNSGASSARNVGEKLSKGEFVLFCDSDVELHEDMLFQMIQSLHENPSCSWCYCDYKIGRRPKKVSVFNPKNFYRVNCCSTMSLIRHEHFSGFDESLPKLQDWDLFLTMYEKGYTPCYVPHELFFAENRPDGISNTGIPESEIRKRLKLKHPEIVIL